MGDAHFLLQNTLTGMVFLAFALAGFWCVDQASATKLIIQTLDVGKWQSIAIIAFSPVIGVLVQGVWMFVIYLPKIRARILSKTIFQKFSATQAQSHPYIDPGREFAAERIRKVIKSLHDTIPAKVSEVLVNAPDDSLFVWLYYSDAPEVLIEWARRRRDFQHLGENWVAGALTGVIFGMLVGGIIIFKLYLIPFFFQGLIGLTLITWVIGLLFLRKQMKRDADSMETMWLCDRLCPDLRERLMPIYKSSKTPPV